MAEYRGYWRRTWEQSGDLPDANIGIAFSGWAAWENALQGSANVIGSLRGDKYISLGGGNANGRFTSSLLQAITTAIQSGQFAEYQGIAYDVEEGDSGLEQVFRDSFAAARAANFKVLVTVSHSAPYGITDALQLMMSFFNDQNINFLSPQLYTNGTETENNYETTAGVLWSHYTQAQALVIPSVVTADLYSSGREYLANQGVTTHGYIQWSRV
ncbi:MAG: hypothetical protein AN482_16220 [Anabaena sp. LE011-02]|jgi:hypothetical protein|nr:MAG: hypothetical protein AN482_16220 [Anabaena sp. LE011-02]